MRTEQQIKDQIVEALCKDIWSEHPVVLGLLLDELKKVREPKGLFPPKEFLTDRVSFHWIKIPKFSHYIPVRWNNKDYVWATYAGCSHTPLEAQQEGWKHIKECLP